MAQDFTILEEYETVPMTIASATVIEAGDVVGLTSGIVVKGTAAHTELGFAPTANASGETTIAVTRGRVLLKGTSDANYAVTDKALYVDLVGTTTQLIDLGESTTDVFQVAADTEAGTVGATTDVKVRINKPITF